MRRWRLVLALILASVMAAPAAQAAVSPEDGPSAVVSGVLTDTAGAAIPGNVEVFAWPTGRPVQVGQAVELTPVGSDHAAKDGRFSVVGDLSPKLAELAAANGGYINFVLEAASGGDVEELHFSRYVGAAEFTAQDASSSRR